MTAPADRYPGLQAAWQRFLRGEPVGLFAEIERASTKGRQVAQAVAAGLGPRVYLEYRPLDEVRRGVQLRLCGL
jgi:hypothetical protein